MHEKKKMGGFVQLVSILLISVAGLSIAVTLLTLGVSQGENWIGSYVLSQIRAIGDACGEVVLHSLKENPDYSGTAYVDIGENHCVAETENSHGDPERDVTITISAHTGEYTKYLRILSTVGSGTPPIITSWKEIPSL